MKKLLILLITLLAFGALFAAALSEGFESETCPAADWTISYANPWPPSHNLMSHSTTEARTGLRSFRFSCLVIARPYDQYLISPELLVSDGDQTVSFWYRSHAQYPAEYFRVGWSSTDTSPFSFIWTEYITATNNTEWLEYSKTDLPVDTKYVAIHFKTYYPRGRYLYIDDFSGPERSLPPNATSLVSPADAATDLLLNTTLDWAPATGNATSYKLSFGTDNPPINIEYNADLGDVLTYDPGALAYGETYYWQVVPYNDVGSAIDCPIWSFTTIDDPTIYAADLPHLENFDSVTAPDLPLSWSKQVSSISTLYDVISYTSASPHSGENHIRLYSYYTADELVLISPMIDPDITTLRARFWAKHGTHAASLIVGTMNEPGARAVFTPQETVPLSGTYSLYAVDFSGYTGTDQYIAFKLDTESSDSHRYIYLDDITIEIPAPEPPEAASLTWPPDDMTTTQNPLLRWTPAITGEPTSGYKVYIAEIGTFTETDLIYEGADTFFQTSGMENGLTYHWKVAAVNTHGATDSAVQTFSTPGANQLAEGFEDSTFPPLGWGGYWTRSTSRSVEGEASAFKSSGSSNRYTLSTPMLTIEVGDSLNFWAAGTYTNSGLEIAYSTDRENWTQIGDAITHPSSDTFVNYNYDLSSLAGNNYYLGFRTTLEYGVNYIDAVIGPDITPLVPEAPTLDEPDDLDTDVNEYTIFQWSPLDTGGIPNSYNLYLDTLDGSTLFASDVTSPYILTIPLPYETTYFWTVEAVNDVGTTQAAVQSFTTRTDPTVSTFPWLEDFGTTTSDAFPPLNWTRASGIYPTIDGIATQWWRDAWLNVTGQSNNAARITIRGEFCNGWLITPPVNIPADGYVLRFDLALMDDDSNNPIEFPDGQADDRFIVGMATNPGMTDVVTLGEWNNTTSDLVFNEIPHTGTEVTFALEGVSGIRYFAFYGESTVYAYGEDNDLMVDNVTVLEIPGAVTLLSPEDGADGQFADGFDLTWQASLTGTTPETYTVMMSQNPANVESDYAWTGIADSFFDPTQATTSPLTYNYGETWYWTVVAHGNGQDSPAATPFSFTIMDDPRVLSLPYSQNFDGVTAPDLPAAWTGYVDSSSSYANVFTSIVYDVSYPYSVRLYNSTDGSADLRLITPEILVPMNDIKLSFSVRGDSGSTLLVGTVDAIDGTGTFNQLESFDLTSTHTVYTVSFAAYAGTDQYICFKHGMGGTSRSIYIDDIMLEELMIDDMAVTAFSGDNAGFIGDEFSYNVSVYNNGTAEQNAYAVQLHSMDSRLMLASIDVTDPLAFGATAEHIIPWTPAAVGNYEVYAKVVLAGDENSANDASDPVTIGVYAETTYMPFIGDMESISVTTDMPINVYWKNSLVETIYLEAEMQMASGTVNAVIYHNNFSQGVTVPVKIWMTHTTENTNAAWLPYANYNLVYDGNVFLPQGVNAVLIPLQTPFQYTGGNLAVRTNRVMDTQYYSSSDKFYYTADYNFSNRSRCYYSDSSEIDPTDPSATSDGTQSSHIPNTGFIVDPHTPVTALDTPVLSYTQTGSASTITWDPVPFAYCYKLHISDDPYIWGALPAITAYATEVIVPLTDARHFCKVVAQSYRHEPETLGRILNPAAVIDFDNSSARDWTPSISTENKD